MSLLVVFRGCKGVLGLFSGNRAGSSMSLLMVKGAKELSASFRKNGHSV